MRSLKIKTKMQKMDLAVKLLYQKYKNILKGPKMVWNLFLKEKNNNTVQ